MPRFRVRHASLIASADLPILPFLAPRVFAQSSIPRGNRQQQGRSNAIQEKAEKRAKCTEERKRREREDGISKTRQTIETTCRKQRTQEASAAGLLQTSGYWKKGTNRPASINRLYADISSFTRQYARSYGTTTSRSPGAAGVKMHLRRRDCRAQPTRTSSPSTLVQHTPLRAERRWRALSIESARLKNYISRLPSWFSARKRVQLGQYRSLRRRLTNLIRWDLTHLDLTLASDGSTKERGLHYAFAVLDRPLYASLRQHTRKAIIKHDPRCVRLSRILFAAGTSLSPHQVWKNWIALDILTRRIYVHRLLIYLLDRKPGRALRFLQVLANDPLLRNRKTEAIADALNHLSKLHQLGLHKDQSWGTDPEAHKREFVPAFMHLFVKSLAGQRDVCSQDLLYNLVELATTEDLKKVFDCLVEHRVRLEFDTVLHYATAFGEAGEVQYALRCLDVLKGRHTATAWKFVVGRERLRWTCAVILRKSMSTSQDFHQTPVVVAALVRLGIKMDILLYNVVMHNAMEAGDYATAFKVYNTLESNDLRPDKYTFSIMLHGCTMQDNPAFFQSFAQHCGEVVENIRDPWLATDYLYYVYIRHRIDKDVEHTSTLLWQSYARFFTTAPLKSLIDYGTTGLRNVTILQDSSALESMYLSPPPVALYIMLQTEIQAALAISNMRVYNLYLKFKSVVKEGGNPEFDALVQNPTIWNAFLLAFCQKQQFANASQLIQDMMEGPVKPNIYSWNIFMQAFFKMGQVQAAERVFDIMRDRGVDPDQFTWGVLLRGYAKSQLVDRIGDTLPHLEAERELDPDLLRHFARVVDRRKLMVTLEENKLQKEASARDKADQEAEEERSRWQPPQFELADVEAATTSNATSVQPDATGSSVLQKLTSRTEEQSGLLQDQPSALPSSTKPPRVLRSQPRSQRANLQDPEVQYRKLQEQLGLVEPAVSIVNDDVDSALIESSSTGPVFKSMIGKGKEKLKVADSGKPATTRKRPRFNLAKPKGGGDLR